VLGDGVYLIVFRIVHILSGVAWGGAVFLFVFFLQPASAKLGPAGAPFMAELLGGRRLVDRLLVVAAFTIGAGLFLYWRDWHEFGSLGTFVGDPFGVSLTIGAVSAILAFLIGLFGTKPGVDRLIALGRQAAQAGGPPAPEAAAEMAAIQGRLKVFARTSLALIVVAVLAMATARAW
jgi:hypothetical protein